MTPLTGGSRKRLQIILYTLYVKLLFSFVRMSFFSLKNIPPNMRSTNFCDNLLLKVDIYYHSRGIILASLNSSLDRSVPYWDLARIVIYPPPSYALSVFWLSFFTKVSFSYLSHPSFLSTLLSHPNS